MSNFATVFSAELEGIGARTIEVEVDLNVGLHAFNIVGLADRALNEARERVNSALKNSGVKPPNRENRKITINLAPAGVKKTGSQYDLAIALGYLVATRQMSRFDASDKLFLGELSLDGRLRSVNGALCVAEMAAAMGFRTLFLPSANANEASAISKIKIVAVDRLETVIGILEGRLPEMAHVFEESRQASSNIQDFSEIHGQLNAKRGLMIAASGRHNLLMSGPPGVGKSFLARALTSILPDLTLEESIEVTKIWSAAGISLNGLVRIRPFRVGHQTASLAAIVGGGAEARPGEVSLAHHGVLFLDELPEFQTPVLEAMRGPIESGATYVARARGSLIFPSRFSLVAAMNPCPCGFHGDPENKCLCTAYEVVKYQKKISGPLLDRIDLQIKVSRVSVEKLRRPDHATGESAAMKAGVIAARERQAARFKNMRPGLRVNADMSSREASEMTHLSHGAESFLSSLSNTAISPRSYYRLLKTARTIADLEDRDKVEAADLAEAWSYRLRDQP